MLGLEASIIISHSATLTINFATCADNKDQFPIPKEKWTCALLMYSLGITSLN